MSKEIKQIESITNSYELFLLLNKHREEAGIKPYRNHSDLVIKIKKELANDLHGHENVGMQEPTNNGGFKEFNAYNLTRKEVFTVAMRESRLVRSSVYDYIENLEAQLEVMKSVVWKVINNKSYLGRTLALQSAGITHPRLFMKYLQSREGYYNKLFDKAILKDQYVSPNTKVVMFTQGGFKWLLNNAEAMNNWVEEQKILTKKYKKLDKQEFLNV